MVRTYAKRKNVASDCAWRENVSQHIFCSAIGKFSELFYNIKTLREDRTAAEWDCVAHATRRRRRILRRRILCFVIGKLPKLSYDTKTLRGDRTAAEWDMSLK